MFDLGRSALTNITLSSALYVPDDERWPEKFRGIGIRIEDSVCVGDDSPIVLTTEAVKEVSQPVSPSCVALAPC